MKNTIILENIRSCYNVWNILRTADALGWSVVLTWYTPSPRTQPKVKKTSLWAEETVDIQEFSTTAEAIFFLKWASYSVIAAEVTEEAVDLVSFQQKKLEQKRAIILGNEVVWVEPETLALVDYVVKIPMMGIKESLNVWQTAAIFMRAMG
jgi:23S rRNA (guanosine2251-2'-O)-methyltransferase